MNRRKFIEHSGRSLILGGLAIVGVVAISREDFNKDSCNNNFLCKKCNQLDNCQLPEAKEIKK